ncbi:tetratricopeptide repeat protein [Fervidibacter sacchari]
MEGLVSLAEKFWSLFYRCFWRWRELRGFYERAVGEAKGDEAIKQAALEIVRSDFFTEFIQRRTVTPEQEFSEFLKRLKEKCPKADDFAITEFLEDVYARVADQMEGHETWGKRGDEIAEFLRQRRQPIGETVFERVPEQRTYPNHFSHIPKASNFLDREEELKRLKEWLKDEEQTVGALVGVGGQGKTYLAAKFAEECLQNGWQVRWADFPFTVEHFLLSIASEMQNCGDQYASIVGDPQQKFEVRIDNAIRFLESQKQPWLIVLDDFHKATEDKWQEVIALFDQHCRKTKILLTARREPEAFEELKLPTGAHEILDVPKLPREVAKDYLQALGLSVDDDRAERIWEKCSGNPVAMKLFAQAARRRSVEKLLQMPLPEWSENAQKWMDELLSDLSELAKEAAKRLSIFDEPVEHDLLLAIGAKEEGLFDLQDYRLAERTIDERWQEHDLLRQYWKAKLSEEERASWHRLAGEWLKGQAERIKAEQEGRKFEDWSLELQQTWANYLHRAFWQFASAEAVKEALKAASPITELLDRWGEWDENLRLCQKALELARKSEDEEAIAIWAHQLAMRHHNRGNYEEAEKLYRESLGINERLGNLQGKAVTLHELGRLAHDRGNYEEAERLYRESLEISERLEYLEGKAVILRRLGLLRKAQGRKDEAKWLLKQALEIFEEMGHRYAEDVRKDLEALRKEE